MWTYFLNLSSSKEVYSLKLFESWMLDLKVHFVCSDFCPSLYPHSHFLKPPSLPFCSCPPDTLWLFLLSLSPPSHIQPLPPWSPDLPHPLTHLVPLPSSGLQRSNQPFATHSLPCCSCICLSAILTWTPAWTCNWSVPVFPLLPVNCYLFLTCLPAFCSGFVCLFGLPSCSSTLTSTVPAHLPVSLSIFTSLIDQWTVAVCLDYLFRSFPCC